MTQDELLRIVQRRGHKARVQGDEILMETCLFCSNSNSNLELNAEKGVYKCWACQESGSLQKLLSNHFGQDRRVPVRMEEKDSKQSSFQTITFGAAFRPALDHSSAKQWLENRDVRPSDIAKYGIQVCVDEEHEHYGRIVFPLKDYWNGKCIGYTSREYQGRQRAKYLHEIKTKTSVGYRTSGTTHVCVEGIFDGIRVHQAGYNTHILLGSGSNERFIEWCASLPRDDHLVLLLDGDEAGRTRSEALKHLAATVRDEPVACILPEGTDPADYDYRVLKHLLEKYEHT